MLLDIFLLTTISPFLSPSLDAPPTPASSATHQERHRGYTMSVDAILSQVGTPLQSAMTFVSTDDVIGDEGHQSRDSKHVLNDDSDSASISASSVNSPSPERWTPQEDKVSRAKGLTGSTVKRYFKASEVASPEKKLQASASLQCFGSRVGQPLHRIVPQRYLQAGSDSLMTDANSSHDRSNLSSLTMEEDGLTTGFIVTSAFPSRPPVLKSRGSSPPPGSAGSMRWSRSGSPSSEQYEQNDELDTDR